MLAIMHQPIHLSEFSSKYSDLKPQIENWLEKYRDTQSAPPTRINLLAIGQGSHKTLHLGSNRRNGLLTCGYVRYHRCGGKT